MNNINKNATTVVAEEVANATRETINAAENAANVKLNRKKMKKKEGTVLPTTKIAIIDGVEKKIVVAHTNYAMEQPKDKSNLMGSINRDLMMSVIFHLAKPEIFWEAGVELFDNNDQLIEKGRENVYVSCPTSGTYWRYAVDERLEHVEVHDFTSVQEYAQAIGCTNLYSRGLNNTEKMGIAALATGDDACQMVFDFAKEHKMSTSTAQHYLDYSIKPSALLELTMGKTMEIMPTIGRSKEEAKELLDVIKKKFVITANKRYVIRPINTLLHMKNKGYSIGLMKTAIESLTEMETGLIENASNVQRESMVSSTLTTHLDKLKSNQEDKDAA